MKSLKSLWLNFKITHGLSPRGRVSVAFRCEPKGLVALILYYLYYRRKDNEKDFDAK